MNKQSKQKFSDTELISADWEKGLQVLNVSSGERRQLRGPAIFVRALSSSHLTNMYSRMKSGILDRRHGIREGAKKMENI